MKKKIIVLTAVLMLFAGVVSASSINGDYKGNPIVKVTSSGKQLETDEVPAMIYDGHTLVPISLLRQIGASVTWDQNTYNVDVKLNQPATSFSLNDIAKEAKNHNIIMVVNSAIGDDNGSNLTFFHKNMFKDNSISNDDFFYVLQTCAKTDAFRCRIYDTQQQVFYVDVKYLKDFYANKITAEELKMHYMYETGDNKPQLGTGNNNSNSTNKNDGSTINGSPVSSGDNPNTFQFIGANAYYDKSYPFAEHIVGQLKNVSGSRTNPFGVNLSVTFFDKNGLVVGSASGTMSSLDPGETKPYDITVLNPPSTAVRYELHVKG